MSFTSQGYASPHGSKKLLATAVTYRPFAVGLAMVLAASYVIWQLRSSQGPVDSQQAMNIFMGCFFVTFALPKFVNLRDFAATFRKYDLISRRFPSYAIIFPFIELGLGLILLSNLATDSMPAGYVITGMVAAISGLGILSVGRSLRQKTELDCACMGTSFAFPLSKVSLIENGVMFVMALIMLVLMHTQPMVMAAWFSQRIFL